MSEQRNEQPVDAFRAAGVVVMAIVVIFGLLGLGVWLMKDGQQLQDAVKLPLLVISGLVSLIALLAVMAIAFKTVHLANQTQALGLPEGTVRAVIALSLILIFAVVTVYLFSDLSDPDNISSQELADVKAQIAKLKPVTTTDTTGTVQTSTALSPADTRRASKLAASQDFAKQLLIMLGTLITSLTSFYFGSKAGTDATSRPAASTQPKVTGVDKPSIAITDLPANVTAHGSGLQPAKNVTLRNSAKAEVGTTGISSNDTAVHFTVPTGTAADKWDVVVKMSDGSESTAPGALTIT